MLFYLSPQLGQEGKGQVTTFKRMVQVLRRTGYEKKLIKIYQVQDRRRRWHPTPVLLPGKSHTRRSLVGCSPWGHEELDTTERLPFQFSLSCFGEGNGNPLQCSCLENPRDGGAWWAAVCGVAQSRTRLKRLSSSSRAHYSLVHLLRTYYWHTTFCVSLRWRQW